MKCIIIGLGTYGKVLAVEFTEYGHEVIGADNDASRVERVKDSCAAVFQIDACDELALSVLPLKKVDVVIVAIGRNLGASVRVVANDYVHRNILQAFDIDRVLIPEERAAHDLVRQMELGVKTSLFRVDGKYCVFMFCIPETFVGQQLNDLHLYEEFGLKIIAVKQAGKTVNSIGIAYNETAVTQVVEGGLVLQADDELVCYGKESDFRKFCRMLKLCRDTRARTGDLCNVTAAL